MIDKVADRSNVYSSVEAWDGGAPRVVADYAEAFGLQSLISGSAQTLDDEAGISPRMLGTIY